MGDLGDPRHLPQQRQILNKKRTRKATLAFVRVCSFKVLKAQRKKQGENTHVTRTTALQGQDHVSSALAPSGKTQLTISVFDNSATLRNTSSYLMPAQTLLDSSAVKQLLSVMEDIVAQQFLSDAPGFPTAIEAISVQIGE
jgi:hypothetical protein